MSAVCLLTDDHRLCPVFITHSVLHVGVVMNWISASVPFLSQSLCCNNTHRVLLLVRKYLLSTMTVCQVLQSCRVAGHIIHM